MVSVPGRSCATTGAARPAATPRATAMERRRARTSVTPAATSTFVSVGFLLELLRLDRCVQLVLLDGPLLLHLALDLTGDLVRQRDAIDLAEIGEEDVGLDERRRRFGLELPAHLL